MHTITDDVTKFLYEKVGRNSLFVAKKRIYILRTIYNNYKKISILNIE